MTTAYQHRPMSEILAPAAESTEKTQTDNKAVVTDTSKAENTLPDKYKDKTVEQVAEMHMHAEKELGRKNNELGTYRGLVTDLSAIQRPQVDAKPAEQEPVNVSGDDLINDPSGSIQKVIKPLLQEAEDRRTEDLATTQVAAEGMALMTAFPDLEATIAGEEFQSFAIRTPGRQADFQTAATGKGVEQVRAARRLMEDYTDFQTATSATEKTELTPIEQAKAATTESSGPAGAISSKPQIFQSDVVKLINSDVLKYRSPSYQSELTAAIKEGRFVKDS